MFDPTGDVSGLEMKGGRGPFGNPLVCAVGGDGVDLLALGPEGP